MPRISVIIPAFNEEATLKEAATKTADALTKYSAVYEIIIVNDGSTDQTSQVAMELTTLNVNIRVASHPENLGLAEAIRTGLGTAKFEWFVFIPADLQFDAKDIKSFIPLLESNDIVAGYRVTRRSYSLFRKLLSSLNLLFYKFFFGLKVRDPNWIVFFRREFLELNALTSKSTFIQGEMLIRALRKGARIAEVRTKFLQRFKGETKHGNLRTAANAFKDMILFR
jgi:glycosyltransferase involved in cell wall biosynthesis